MTQRLATHKDLHLHQKTHPDTHIVDALYVCGAGTYNKRATLKRLGGEWKPRYPCTGHGECKDGQKTVAAWVYAAHRKSELAQWFADECPPLPPPSEPTVGTKDVSDTETLRARVNVLETRLDALERVLDLVVNQDEPTPSNRDMGCGAQRHTKDNTRAYGARTTPNATATVCEPDDELPTEPLKRMVRRA